MTTCNYAQISFNTIKELGKIGYLDSSSKSWSIISSLALMTS